MESSFEGLYNTACKCIDGEKDALFRLSDQIWKNPELNFEEYFAHDLLTEFLDGCGFTVTRNYHLETAFRATFSRGTGGPNVALLCEYDALPDIGHACGHNLISEVGVAAGLGLKAVVEKLPPEFNGTITILGTPAEEGGGGKVKMLDAGCFDGITVAMMAHPLNADILAPAVLAKNSGVVTYRGRAAHAAAAPWEGINALDAAVCAYTNLSMMRQQMKPSWRVHSVITDGGTKPNIIPERATMAFYIRAPVDDELAVLKEKTTAVFQSAGQSTGCDVDLQYDTTKPAFYSNLVTNKVLSVQFRNHWQRVGGVCPQESGLLGSTDMGNVSYVVPSIHPMFSVGTSAPIHTHEFQKSANTAEAHVAALAVAKAIACAGVDILLNEDFLHAVRKEFVEGLGMIKN